MRIYLSAGQLIRLDQVCNKIPLFSVIPNLFNLVLKKFFIKPNQISPYRYLTYLEKKSYEDCIQLMIPVIGNIIVHLRHKAVQNIRNISPVLENDTLEQAYENKLKKMFAIISKKLTVPGKFSVDPSNGHKSWQEAIKEGQVLQKEIWNNQQFIEDVSYFMDNARQLVDIYYRELKERGEGNPKKMVEVMTSQNRDNGERIFCDAFFYDNITNMYSLARNAGFFVDYNNALRMSIDYATEEYRNLFFKEGTPHFRWRTQYNEACAKIDEYQLRKPLSLKDPQYFHDRQRYIGWSTPDNDIGNRSFKIKAGRPT